MKLYAYVYNYMYMHLLLSVHHFHMILNEVHDPYHLNSIDIIISRQVQWKKISLIFPKLNSTTKILTIHLMYSCLSFFPYSFLINNVIKLTFQMKVSPTEEE